MPESIGDLMIPFTSEAKRESNRRNAQKSTGPKTHISSVMLRGMD